MTGVAMAGGMIGFVEFIPFDGDALINIGEDQSLMLSAFESFKIHRRRFVRVDSKSGNTYMIPFQSNEAARDFISTIRNSLNK